MVDDSDQVANYNTEEENKFINKKRSNIKSDLIEITEDKLENILLKHIHKLGIRKSWITPLSLLITIILANLSASFGNKFGINGYVWEAFFMLVAICSAIWLIVSLVRIAANWSDSSLSTLISIIKNAKD